LKGTKYYDDTGLRQFRVTLKNPFKGGPEPLEKEINEILGSKREDRFPDPFF